VNVHTADFSINVSFIFSTEFANMLFVTLGGSNDYFPSKWH